MVFTGFAQNPEGPIMAGLDALALQDGRQVDYASEITADADHMIDPITTLGHHGPRDHKSMGYDATLSINTFLLLGENVNGALFLPGWQADGSYNLNTAGSFDFTITNVYTGVVLKTALKCKLATESLAVPNRGLLTNATTWKSARILPGIQTS